MAAIRLCPRAPRAFPRISHHAALQSRHHTISHSPTPPSSANPTEVQHFSLLASSWWDPHGPSRLLHLMNPLRHRFIASCLPSLPSSPTLRYLDIGCGGGIFAESAARLPSTASVRAIDPSLPVLTVARQHATQDPILHPSTGRLTYLHTTIEDLPAPTSEADQVDVLTLFEVLEHVDHPAPFLESCLPFVKPGGWIVASTIARTWTSWLTTKVVAEDLARIVPRGTHDWGKYINEEELRGWFNANDGWGQARSQGVVYVPGMGWKEVRGGEGWGNYFFGVRKSLDG